MVTGGPGVSGETAPEHVAPDQDTRQEAATILPQKMEGNIAAGQTPHRKVVTINFVQVIFRSPVLAALCK